MNETKFSLTWGLSSSKTWCPRLDSPVSITQTRILTVLSPGTSTTPILTAIPSRTLRGTARLGCQLATQLLFLIFAETCLMALMDDHISLICILQLLGTIFYKPIRSSLLIVLCTSSTALVLFGLNVPSISERGVLKFPTVVHFSLFVLSNSAYVWSILVGK